MEEHAMLYAVFVLIFVCLFVLGWERESRIRIIIFVPQYCRKATELK